MTTDNIPVTYHLRKLLRIAPSISLQAPNITLLYIIIKTNRFLPDLCSLNPDNQDITPIQLNNCDITTLRTCRIAAFLTTTQNIHELIPVPLRLTL